MRRVELADEYMKEPVEANKLAFDSKDKERSVVAFKQKRATLIMKA